MDLKTQLETVAKNHQASIQNLETKFDRLADKQSGRPSGSLPSNTQPNPKGHNSKAYQPPQSRNEHVNVVFTRSGKSYNPPVNQNDQQNDSETLINFDSDDEDEEPTPQPKTQNPKPVKETPLPKPYKPKMSLTKNVESNDSLAVLSNVARGYKEVVDLSYSSCKEEHARVLLKLPEFVSRVVCYFWLVVVQALLEVNVELISNKHKIKQISAAFLSDESSAMIQNKVPPKLGDPGSFLIPCNFDKTFSCNALADLGASINLMPYSLYAKLSLKTLKPTKMSIRNPSRSKNTLREFDEFMAMTADENFDSESDTEDAPFKKITINTNYKIKTSLEEPPTDLKLKPLPDNLEYVFLEEPSFLPVILSSQLSKEKKSKTHICFKKVQASLLLGK
ncbi:reverse transcriptase domain-containing protein [Tanacetum coccineum]